ncbi:hypothetical protein N7U66_00660 [Lacinutrix neustonica]|uniref:Uncharacterized protein n=1 Tax=Lacinutrix neustonica TaxID=2980107 RepID=A0A9E8MXE1_9FLAO|nr:hypothetical protein [Lacinutrix neustonica]WAC02307.1 hypothetical protein N7U66_00660 [Lacinutrix neustonica]
MTWNIIQLIIDFGLVVLIRMVQLLIYPAFKYFNKTELYLRHSHYTMRMALIVAPLMLSQLVISIYSWYLKVMPLAGWHLVLVIPAWISTVVFFIPLHKKLSHHNSNSQLLLKLVLYNWLRVIIWTAVFILSIIQINRY